MGLGKSLEDFVVTFRHLSLQKNQSTLGLSPTRWNALSKVTRGWRLYLLCQKSCLAGGGQALAWAEC